jgi:hypothetical protein
MEQIHSAVHKHYTWLSTAELAEDSDPFPTIYKAWESIRELAPNR